MVVARNFGERNYEVVSLQACAKCESTTMGPRNPARQTALLTRTPGRLTGSFAAGPGHAVDSLPIASYTALSVTLETHLMTSGTADKYW